MFSSLECWEAQACCIHNKVLCIWCLTGFHVTAVRKEQQPSVLHPPPLPWNRPPIPGSSHGVFEELRFHGIGGQIHRVNSVIDKLSCRKQVKRSVSFGGRLEFNYLWRLCCSVVLWVVCLYCQCTCCHSLAKLFNLSIFSSVHGL